MNNSTFTLINSAPLIERGMLDSLPEGGKSNGKKRGKDDGFIGFKMGEMRGTGTSKIKLSKLQTVCPNSGLDTPD